MRKNFACPMLMNDSLRTAKKIVALAFVLFAFPYSALAQQRIVPLGTPRSLQSSAIVNLSGFHLNYYGGRVISNVQVAVVFWTSSVDATTQSQIEGFYSTVTTSSYMDLLSEYDTVGLTSVSDGLLGSNQLIGQGTAIGPFTVTPNINTTTTVDDNDIQAELQAQITAGHLPAPATDGAGNVNTLYMVYFPLGYTITLQGAFSCQQFCGYHGTYVNNNLSIPYGVMPDLSGSCNGRCGSDPTVFNNLTSVSSHELAESITDTEVGLVPGNIPVRPLAWYDQTYGEIGDICNHQHVTLSGYTVQKEWSNLNNACIASEPARSSSTATLQLTSFVVHSKLRVTASFSVTVAGSGPTPTGQVNFFDGEFPLGSATLSSGAATFSTSQLRGGVHNFQASYMGDTNYLPSGSNTQTFRYRAPISR